MQWESEQTRQQECRERVLENRPTWLSRHAIAWMVVLFVYAIGGTIADRFNTEAFVGIFLGIGFGILLSNALGLIIAMLSKEHERVLYQWVWVRSLWWAHAPWLAIGPLTLVGSLLGALFRITDPDTGSDIFSIVIMPIFLGWIIFFFVAAVCFTRRYNRSCALVGISNSNTVVTLHSVWALAVLIGSGAVGLMGGAIGVFFIEFVLGNDPFMF